MKYRFFVVVGIIVLTLVAAGLTEAALLIGHGEGQIADDVLHRPQSSRRPFAVPTASPLVTAAPAPTVVSATPAATVRPEATATPLPAGSAVTVSYVRLRAGASTETAVLAELDGGTVVTLGAYRDASWQQVSVGGQTGYVYRAYLKY